MQRKRPTWPRWPSPWRPPPPSRGRAGLAPFSSRRRSHRHLAGQRHSQGHRSWKYNNYVEQERDSKWKKCLPVCKEDQGEHPLLHPVRVVDPLGQHALLHLLDQLRLLHVVRHRVGGHVEQQEVLLLCCQHTLLNLINCVIAVLKTIRDCTKFFARRSLTFFSWYLSFRGFQVSPDKYSIHVCNDKMKWITINGNEKSCGSEAPGQSPVG